MPECAHTLDLFEGAPPVIGNVALAPGAWWLRGFALKHEAAVMLALDAVVAGAPFRHLVTPGGYRMSVAMTNCGALGWVSDRHGYRYGPDDPLSGQPWPTMPVAFRQLAEDAADMAGFARFAPDACLVNRYQPGARLSLHQDREEHGFDAPIVSVSLGLPAVFAFGGDARSDKPQRIPLVHGDVVVWGGPSRMRYHGVQPIKPGYHPQLGAQRINLTFRKAAP